NDPETDETFGIGLTEGEGATLGAPRTALVTIIDNDSPNQPSASANVLFVAGSPNLSESDQVIRQEFERLGHVVTVQDDDLSSTADVANQDLVFVSESVVSRKVGDTFSRVDIPVISAEAYIFDDMAWTETALNADFGTLASATRLVIDSTATTELTAGLTGEVTVFNPTGEIAWGNPNANATTVATLPNNGDRAGIFTYEAGASLVDGSTASSRQAGFFLGADAQNLSPEGWNLFAATVSWALGTPLEITPELAFASSNTTVDEGDGTATVTVRRLGDTSQQIQVDYGTSDDSAEAGLDYTTTSGTLVFNPGVATLTIEVPILEDSDSELNESFNLTLSNPVGIDLGATTTATVTINDNDNSTVINNGDFVRETIASGLFLPTAFDWIPGSDTILVAEKDGLVKVVQDGVVQATPLLDLTERVNNAGDRGLGGLAVHPDFANTPYVYLAYTLDPPETQSFPDDRNSKPDGRGNRPSQVIRITVSMDPVTNAVSVVPDSEVILLGNNSLWEFTTQGNSTAALGRPQSGIAEDGSYIEDYLVTDSLSHSVGMLQFGTDGSLFVANGDGASFNFADPRAVRVQDIDSLSGKILRVDPITGEGLGDNPFFNGDPNSNRSKVHSYGLRNPFRFAINKDTNTPYIGDVGWTQWEEINTGVGVNYGWPYYEGGDNEINLPTSEYDQLPEAQAFYASGELATAPIFAIDHE
ncbi:MAG: PQQ-dependent sugar dehydrogenase, partial [Leptolyngbyaceae cyanobacterium]